MQPLYSLICCNHLVEILCKKLLFARMWPSECEICEMHAMCLNLDNFGHCERRLLFNTHDLWNSLSVYFFCLPTHSTLDIHFIAVDDLKTKAYESKEKIMSRTVDLISKNRLIHHAFLFSFSMHHEMFSQHLRLDLFSQTFMSQQLNPPPLAGSIVV